MRKKTATMRPKIERLRRCPLFAAFPDSELTAIAEIADEIDVPAGRVLTRQGDPAREAFIVVEGQCRVLVDDVEIATLGPGDVVGEMGLLEVSTRSATVVTDTAAQLLALDPRQFTALVERRPVNRQLMRQLAARLRAADGDRVSSPAGSCG